MSKTITVQDGDLILTAIAGQIILESSTDLQIDMPLFILEQAAANTNVSTYGQFWVKDDAPNVPMFTDDLGTDFSLLGIDTSGTPVNNQVAIWTDSGTLEGDANLTYDSALEQLLVPSSNNAATPAIGIGFTNQGFYAVSSSIIGVVVGGSLRARFGTGSFGSNLPSGFDIFTQVNAGATQPVYSFAGDANTGIGKADADQLSLISGGAEIVRMVHTGLTDHMRVLGPIFIEEAASEDADIAGFGQIWVRNNDPNTLMFTDDLGTDFVIGGSLTSSALITVADTASTSTFLVMTDNATGDEAPLTDGGLTYNAGTAALSTTTFIGALSGNATTATALATGRTIGMTGNVVWTSASFTGAGNVTGTATIQSDVVTMDMIVDIATDTFLGRVTAATGTVEVLTNAQAKTALDLTGTNSGDQTITLTGDVGGSGTGSFAATIAADAVTYAKMQNVVADNVFLGNNAGAGAIVDELTGTEATALLDLFATASTVQGLAPGSNGAGATAYLDGTGTWSTPAGGGGGTVTSSGTPLNNEVAVFTSGTDIDSDSTFTWDGTNLALTGTTHLVLPQTNDSATPTLAFGDGDSGFFELASNIIRVAIAGTGRFQWTENEYQGTANSSASMLAISGNATTPVFRFNGDLNTGIGRSAADELSLIAGGVQAVRYCETSSAVIVNVQSNVGLTAHVGSAQGDGVIQSTYNVYSTVGTTGDAATLPASFQVGTKIYVKNNGANSMDVFPASGDDAGAGANIAIAVAAGTSVTFISTVLNTTWTQLIELAAGGAPDQNLWLTVDGDTGSTAANITTDTLTIAGGTGITTAMSGDTLTVTQDTITLGTNTTGNYVGTITGGTGIDSTGATTGEGIAHTLSFDASELGVATMVTGDWIVFDNAGVSNKALISAIPLSIFNNDLGISTTLDGLSDTNITTVANGHLLMWDATPGEWVNATTLEFAYTFNNIVSFTGNVTGDSIELANDAHLLDTAAIGFGTGATGVGDVRIFWDNTDLEVVGLNSNQTINFRDGHHLRLWDSTDTDWFDIHNNGTNLILTESGLTQITFPAAGTLALDMNDNIIDTARLKDYSIESDAPAVSGTAVTLTYSSGPAFEIDLEPSSGNVVITITGGPPAGTHGQITVKVQQDGASVRTVSFTSGTFRHAGGTIHTMNPTADGFSIYTLETWDSGTIWYVGGADYS